MTKTHTAEVKINGNGSDQVMLFEITQTDLKTLHNGDLSQWHAVIAQKVVDVILKTGKEQQ